MYTIYLMDVKPTRSNVLPLEQQLIKRAQQGEQEAFGTLYEIHFDAVYRYIRFRLGNVEDTEDFTTLVFLRAWQNIGNYVCRGMPFLAWLYRIAHNLVADFYRGKKPEMVDIEGQNELPDTAPAPERQIAVGLQLQDVLKAMNELSSLQQEVLTLRFMLDLSHRQVADIIGRSEGAIRIIQYRALQSLRQRLDA